MYINNNLGCDCSSWCFNLFFKKYAQSSTWRTSLQKNRAENSQWYLKPPAANYCIPGHIICNPHLGPPGKENPLGTHGWIESPINGALLRNSQPNPSFNKGFGDTAQKFPDSPATSVAKLWRRSRAKGQGTKSWWRVRYDCLRDSGSVMPVCLCHWWMQNGP